MSIVILKIKSILSEIFAELQKADEKEMADHLLAAYKTGINNKELAYDLGLWKQMLFDKNPRLGQSLNRELNYLHDCFEELKVEEYFDLQKQFVPQYNNHHRWIITVGLLLSLVGILEVAQTIIPHHSIFIIAGILIIIAGLLKLKYNKDRKRFYRKFKA